MVLTALIFGSPAFAQPVVEDEFEGLDTAVWCYCQIDMQSAPVAFLPDPERPGNRFTRITVDAASLGGNRCQKEAPALECGGGLPMPAQPLLAAEVWIEPDLPGPLGPSLVHPPGAALAQMPYGDSYCTPEKWLLAHLAGEEGGCIQRQELRFQTFRHDADVPHWYSFRFRMPAAGSIEDRTRSIRWVTAQWKQQPLSREYAMEFGDAWGPSPFLAQRFDDGVLHVTVQDEHCRCKVASAPYPDGSSPPWTNGTPPYCESTHPKDAAGTACTPNLMVEYGDDPILSTALGSWVEMRYLVTASRSNDAVIEVYERTRFIVRITGRIGYRPDPAVAPITKFKIGHYRDYMPFEHAMDIDWLRVEPLAR
jgi:hypothetical protein